MNSIRTSLLLSAIYLLLISGCQPSNSSTEQVIEGDANSPQSAADNRQTTSSGEIATSGAVSPQGIQGQSTSATPGAGWISATELPRETWEVIYLGAEKIGYTHSTMSSSKLLGPEVLVLKNESLIRLKRGKDVIQQRLTIDSIEQTDGVLRSVTAEISDGKNLAKTIGNVVSKVLQFQTSGGARSSPNIPWESTFRGPFAIEQLLRNNPILEGEVRTANFINPPLFELCTVKITGLKPSKTGMLDGSMQTLQEVKCDIENKGRVILTNSLWLDQNGELVKSFTPGVQMTLYRCDRSFAEAVSDEAEADLLLVTSVPLSKTITAPHAREPLTYRLRLNSGGSSTLASSDPFQILSKKSNQTVRSIDAATCDVTIHPISPESVIPEGIDRQDAPVPADLESSPLIQSDAASIVALAAELTQSETDPWKTALLLEKGVHKKINRKDFSRAFASAEEVALQLQGDCTEHAVLLAALLRAKKIPARVASGLVYVEMEKGPAMGYHMWTEAYVGDRWIPLDATLGNGGIGGGHIKVFESSLSDHNPYTALLPVLQIIGKTEIEVQSGLK